MKDKDLKKLLKYEVDILRWCDKFENGLNNLDIACTSFTPDLPSHYYELLNIVLDILNVPKDSDISRDKYSNLYYLFYTDINNNNYTILLKNLKKILKGKNENKKRIRK